MMWKLDTKSAAWVSLDVGIHSDSSLVSSYPSQITLYKNLHAHQQSILYLDSPLIITRVEASCILLEKVLDIAGSSMNT